MSPVQTVSITTKQALQYKDTNKLITLFHNNNSKNITDQLYLSSFISSHNFCENMLLKLQMMKDDVYNIASCKTLLVCFEPNQVPPHLNISSGKCNKISPDLDVWKLSFGWKRSKL